MGKKKKKESAEDKLINIQAQQLAAQVANWAATLEFQKERFRLLEMPEFQQGLQLEVDKLAWQKAQDTWERGYQEALMTGTYNGQPTTQWLLEQARLTGSYNGERTLEGKLTDAQIQDMNDKMRLANEQFVASTTGYYNGQKTFDREKFEQAQALEGWKFISTLSGPQNAFKQARAIASMPGGMNQMMNAFAGQYMLPSGTAVGPGGGGGAAGQLSDMMMGGGGMNTPPQTPGVVTPPAVGPAPQPRPPSGIIPGRGFAPNQWNDATRQAVATWEAQNPGWKADGSQLGYIGSGAPAATGYTYSPPGVQAPANTWNYSATQTGDVAVYPPGVQSPAQTADVSSPTPRNPAEVAPYVYGGGMPLPNQINAENYDNAYQYQKDLMWAGYEDAQWDKGLAQEAFMKSLPKYGGPSKGTVAAF